MKTDFSEWSHESLVQFAQVAYAKLEAQADELAHLRLTLLAGRDNTLDAFRRPHAANPQHAK